MNGSHSRAGLLWTPSSLTTARTGPVCSTVTFLISLTNSAPPSSVQSNRASRALIFDRLFCGGAAVGQSPDSEYAGAVEMGRRSYQKRRRLREIGVRGGLCLS